VLKVTDCMQLKQHHILRPVVSARDAPIIGR